MILFWILFLLIVLISAILAILSMKDFKQSPQDFSTDNGLFLIRKPYALTLELFDRLHLNCVQEGLIISLERLFKGGESALVLYGPKRMLLNLTQSLDLIELEDYPRSEEILIWEIGVRTPKHYQVEESLFLDFPKLLSNEQVWYQIVLQAQKGESKKFIAQIRVIVLISDENRRNEISRVLQAGRGSFMKVPKPLSSETLMNFYMKRSLLGKTFLKLTGEEISKLMSLPLLLSPPSLPPVIPKK